LTLKGYRTYLVAICTFLIGLAGYIDPSVATFIGKELGVEPELVLMLSGLVMMIMRKITDTPPAI